MAYENLDQELLNALLADGRASLRSLSEQKDVSVTTVSNHLSDLEDSGVIEGYTPIVDYGAFGYDVTAVLQLKVEGSALPTVTDRLSDHDKMVSVYEVTGHHDIVAVGKFLDTDEMNDELKALLAEPDIQSLNTSVVLNSACENEQFELDVEFHWFAEREREFPVVAGYDDLVLVAKLVAEFGQELARVLRADEVLLFEVAVGDRLCRRFFFCRNFGHDSVGNWLPTLKSVLWSCTSSTDPFGVFEFRCDYRQFRAVTRSGSRRRSPEASGTHRPSRR